MENPTLSAIIDPITIPGRAHRIAGQPDRRTQQQPKKKQRPAKPPAEEANGTTGTTGEGTIDERI